MSLYRSIYKMEGDAYAQDMHFLHKAISDITFPISKEDLLKIAGDRTYRDTRNTTKTVRELVEPFKREYFENAHQFYNSVIAYIYK